MGQGHTPPIVPQKIVEGAFGGLSMQEHHVFEKVRIVTCMTITSFCEEVLDQETPILV